jgi:putative membrane protein
VPQADSTAHVRRRFRVRPLLVRFVVSALALALTAIIVPNVYMTGDYRILSWLLISVVFGLLVAFVKPLIQLLLLPFIFVSYGLVVVLINTCVLWLLDLIFPTRFQVESIVWALVAGAVSGALVGLFENVLGLAPPIVQDEPPELKEEIERRALNVVEKTALAVSGDASASSEGTATEPDPDWPEEVKP